MFEKILLSVKGPGITKAKASKLLESLYNRRDIII